MFNEYYLRDTSRKIKSVFQAKGKSGKHVTGTVIYGYLWNETRDKWIVDPEAAEIVKRIFAMTIDGYGPYQIASKLSEEKILIPAAHFAKHDEGVNKNKTFKDVYGWGSSTIVHILKKREYLGHTCNFKTRKHFKDKKSHYVPEDEWTIFENTHEAIIDQQTYNLVQKIRGSVKRYPNGWGEAAPLTGLLYCADCGGKMYVHRVNNGKRISQYTCSQYSKIPVGKLCSTQHRINEDVVLTLISDMLKAIAEYARHDRAEFVRVVQEAQSSQQTAEVRKNRTRLATAKQRLAELETLLCKIYEDNALGKLSDSRYQTLGSQYDSEQSKLTAEVSALEKSIHGYEKHEKMQHFVRTLNRFYLEHRELWENDSDWGGYEWIEPDDRDNSVIAFRRKDRKGRELVVVCNFCPVLRENYRLGLPKQGWYVPVLNTDDEAFGGYGFKPEIVRTEKTPSHNQKQSGLFRIPPMSVCFYRYTRARPQTKP